MKKYFTLTFLFGFFLNMAFAQQPAQYSLYMLNKFGFNPAYAGLDNSLSLTGVYRKQWVKLPNSPSTQNVNVHLPFYILSGGIGIELENESLGNWEQTRAMLAYNFQIPLRKTGVISLGLSGGFVQRSLDGAAIRTPNGIYPDIVDPVNIDHQDLILPNSFLSGSTFAFNFGAFFQGEHLEVGLSAINLTEEAIDLDPLQFKPERNYYFYLGYSFDMSRKLSLLPSLLVKSNVIQTQTDLSILAKYNDNIFLGGSFRGYDSNSIDAIALIGGLKLSEKITLSYSYDLTLSNLKTVSNGSHEILINYNLGKPVGKGKPPKIIYNPRFL